MSTVLLWVWTPELWNHHANHNNILAVGINCFIAYFCAEIKKMGDRWLCRQLLIAMQKNLSSSPPGCRWEKPFSCNRERELRETSFPKPRLPIVRSLGEKMALLMLLIHPYLAVCGQIFSGSWFRKNQIYSLAINQVPGSRTFLTVFHVGYYSDSCLACSNNSVLPYSNFMLF